MAYVADEMESGLWVAWKPLMDYSMQLVPSLLAPLVAVWIALTVTRRIADLQLKKDLYDRRLMVFEATGEFMKPILWSPSDFTLGGDEHRKFWEVMQSAEMLFGRGGEVNKYLEEINRTATSLCASKQKMASNPGDSAAIEENGEQFQHLSDLWQKRADSFRRDLDLSTKTKGSDVKYSLLNVVIGMLAGLLIAGAFAKFWRSPAHAQVHRISVNYPSRWDAGEFRNCGLRQPHYSGDWPELDCDGSRQPWRSHKRSSRLCDGRAFPWRIQSSHG